MPTAQRLAELFHIHKSRIWFLARYGVSGAFGAFVQTFSLYIWVSVLGITEHYLVGAALGLIIALIVTFLLQKYWTFRERTHHRVHKQFGMYTVVALINLGVNLGLLHLSKVIVEGLGHNFFHIWYLVAQVIIVTFVSLMSFLLNYFFTFRRVPHPES